MRGKWWTLGWLGAGLLLAAGCKTPAPNLKPPPRPEELVSTPADDSRFSKPVQYPEDTLNQFPNKKKDDSNKNGFGAGGMNGGGMGGGMGGMSPGGMGGP
jgi:hypothetical protein